MNKVSNNTNNVTTKTLYLVGTPIGNLLEFNDRAKLILSLANVVYCEDTRQTLKLLNQIESKAKLIKLNQINEETKIPEVLNFLSLDQIVCLVSDAGYPLISDPGYKIVQAAIDKNYQIISIAGSSAPLQALLVSGLNPNRFLFYGFLKRNNSEIKKQFSELIKVKETLIFFESPHRTKSTLKLMLTIFGNRKVAVVREISKRFESAYRGTLESIIEDLPETIKGEVVIVLDGNSETSAVNSAYSDSEIIECVNNLIKNKNISRKDAIKEIAKQFNLPKNYISNLVFK